MARPSHRLLSLFGPEGRPAPREERGAVARGPSGGGPAGDGPDGSPPYTVSQLLSALKLHVKRFHQVARQPTIDVVGEVSSLRRPGSGHVYFSLKDKDGRLPCALYASAASRLRFDLEEGLKVVATGRVDLYPARMEVQLIVDELVPVGQGSLALAFEQLKRRLAAEGLFDPASKRSPPLLPRRVGLVTSRDAAALRDVLKVLWGRMPGMPVLLSPSRVQGEGAAEELARALGRLDRSGRCDVIVLARGGGSLEDLWAFNEPALIYAIAQATTPVISGVGHETDVTIADLAADVRAATPSHAAACAVPERQALEARLAELERRLRGRARARLSEARLRLQRSLSALGEPRLVLFPARGRLVALERRLRTAGQAAAGKRHARLSVLEARLLRAAPRRVLEERKRRLSSLFPRLLAAQRKRHEEAERALALLAARLEALSPLKVLGRGYSLVLRPEGEGPRLVKRADELVPGQRVELRFQDGSVFAQVDTPARVGDEGTEPPSEG